MTTTNTRLGEVRRAGDGSYTVRFERHLSHPPERVWAALTDPEEARQWFTELVLEPGIGGRLHLDFGDEGQADGEVVAWAPPTLLEHTWTERGTTSRVRWELRPEREGTHLALTHTGLPPRAPHEYGAGWHDFLDRLPPYLAGEALAAPGEGFPALLETYRIAAEG